MLPYMDVTILVSLILDQFLDAIVTEQWRRRPSTRDNEKLSITETLSLWKAVYVTIFVSVLLDNFLDAKVIQQRS